jgi:hypothetical protein
MIKNKIEIFIWMINHLNFIFFWIIIKLTNFNIPSDYFKMFLILNLNYSQIIKKGQNLL